VIFKVSVSHDHKRLAAQRGGPVLPYIAFSKHPFSSYEDKGVLQIGPPPVKGAAFALVKPLTARIDLTALRWRKMERVAKRFRFSV
jgi:hypothetical protein